MLSGLILTIGCLFFIILLIISYFSKSSSRDFTTKLYKYLLLVTLFIAVTEIISGFLFYYLGQNIIFTIVLKFHWLLGVLYFYLLFFYCICFINNYKYNSFEECTLNNKYLKTSTSVFVIVSLISMILPFDKLDKNDYSFVPGISAYFIIVYAIVLAIFLFIQLYKTKNIKIAHKKAFFASFLPLFIMGVFIQIPFHNYGFFPIGFTVQLIVFYFYVENPDLKLIDEMDLLNRRIQRSSRAKIDFLSNMSHEIRSPMNAIVGFSSTILEETEFDKEKIINDISHIKSSSKTLLEIINNILDISKIETGSENIDEKEYSLRNHIIDWTGIVETRLENKNIKFFLNVDGDMPTKLIGDSTKVFQIVLNLLTNAVKYTEVGKITMTITKKYINDRTIKMTVKVADTGFGIKDEDKDKVFQKFSRLDAAKTNEIEGTGLGLVLTKRYAELMGGDIWFESKYGAGSTFYFEVTQKIVDKTPIGVLTNEKDLTEIKDYLDCSNYTAVIVDDDELNLNVTERLLSAYNFKIVKINNGSDCIYRFKSGEKYDIAFIDHVMSGMDGIEVAHILRNLPGYQIPILVSLTANALIGVREMYLNEGFNEYLSKPIDVNELDRLINKYFNKQ